MVTVIVIGRVIALVLVVLILIMIVIVIVKTIIRITAIEMVRVLTIKF